MGRSQINDLKRRIEALERSPFLQPPPKPPDCRGMVRAVAIAETYPRNFDVIISLDQERKALRLKDLPRVQEFIDLVEKTGHFRLEDLPKPEPRDALDVAIDLERRRAAFTQFAEYERAYSELCMKGVPITCTDSTELQIARKITSYSWHGRPMVPEGFEVTVDWIFAQDEIWETKCKSALNGRTPGG